MTTHKRGLVISQVLKKEHAVLARGMSASVERDTGRVRARLEGDAPQALFVQLARATRAGHDQRLRPLSGAPAR